MDLVGPQSYGLTAKSIAVVLNSFAASLGKEWPEMLVSVGWEVSEWIPYRSKGVPAVRNDVPVFFVRDQAMLDHFDEWSYTPQEDGQGGLALDFAQGADFLGSVRQNKDFGYSSFTMSNSHSWLIFTTPGPVETHEFSKHVHELLTECL